MSTSNASSYRVGVNTIRLIGAAGFWAALAGVASAALLIYYPPTVPAEVFSYPFNGMGFTMIQLFFGLQHFILAALLVALLWTPAVGSSRLARAGLRMSTASMLGLAVLEFIAIAAADTVTGDPLNTAVLTAYGILSIAIGAALVVGGIGVIKSGAWSGTKRILPLVLGIYVFVPVLPALMGPSFVGRIALGGWMLLFALLGWILWRGDTSVLQESEAINSENVAQS
ncbi:hypothetical protein AS189_08320 [Arthrobacter alpinus]|uniref:Uncharacterized protein n=1 Tax=Arthrobacter alpinus TaxID=656366 RepID=A0A0S2LYL8_9MICC|nr:hypothetical protein [Arthrobacter alpinus]ALO66494.1 hypothetical protein AS189_08320 [Arthrobacter alpinus]